MLLLIRSLFVNLCPSGPIRVPQAPGTWQIKSPLDEKHQQKPTSYIPSPQLNKKRKNVQNRRLLLLPLRYRRTPRGADARKLGIGTVLATPHCAPLHACSTKVFSLSLSFFPFPVNGRIWTYGLTWRHMQKKRRRPGRECLLQHAQELPVLRPHRSLPQRGSEWIRPGQFTTRVAKGQ